MKTISGERIRIASPLDLKQGDRIYLVCRCGSARHQVLFAEESAPIAGNNVVKIHMVKAGMGCPGYYSVYTISKIPVKI